jgi:hypothetical protein
LCFHCSANNNKLLIIIIIKKKSCLAGHLQVIRDATHQAKDKRVNPFKVNLNPLLSCCVCVELSIRVKIANPKLGKVG